MSGTLYIVATPIGNLGDISLRAVQTLEDVDFIAAEDTRVTRKLVEHLSIKKQLVSYYEHNSRTKGDAIVQRLLSGESCALVTDAGTPGISDPGEDLVRLCVDAGINILAIPGPCAAVAALAISGLPTGRFVFEGFLSTARKSRFDRLQELKTEKRTMVFYEAPHKLKRTLGDLLSVFGDRRISISREMTKIYEETIRCTLSEAAALFDDKIPRGEFVLTIEGALENDVQHPDIDHGVALALSYIGSGLSLTQAAKKAAEVTGASRNILYDKVMKKRKEQ